MIEKAPLVVISYNAEDQRDADNKYYIEQFTKWLLRFQRATKEPGMMFYIPMHFWQALKK